MATTDQHSDDRLVSLLEMVIERLDRIEKTLDARSFRDHADRAALESVAMNVGGESFSSNDLAAHARAVPALRSALSAADVDIDASALGMWLAGRAGARVGPVRLERVGRSARGIAWQFVE